MPEPTSSFQTPDFATKMGARPGVPFDSTSGISFMSRLRAAAQPTPAEEEKALKAAYGEDKVRRNQFGYLVVTKPGADGKPVDTLADPIGLDIGDAAALVGELPKIVGAKLSPDLVLGCAQRMRLARAPFVDLIVALDREADRVGTDEGSETLAKLLHGIREAFARIA